MKETPGKEASKKKNYVAPMVMKVDLTPEEVMLGFCKAAPNVIGDITGRTHSLCNFCATNYGS